MSNPTEAYINTYHPHLSPWHMHLSLLKAGYRPPKVTTACELGFGQGVSLAVHAAGSADVTWFGNDFHPEHVRNAQALINSSGSSAHLYEEPFDQFCARDDLPDFDFIALHGVWSWISEQNRKTIADFVRGKLKIGGVLSVSYNTLHGWMAMHPLRDLMIEHVRSQNRPDVNLKIKVGDAIEFVERVLLECPDFASKQSVVSKRFESLKKSNRAYLVGEYFCGEWHPMSFSRIADYMQQIECDYAGADIIASQLDFLNLSKSQNNFLHELSDWRCRENTRDFLMQNPFRKDYWIKGGEKLSLQEQEQELQCLEMAFVLPLREVKWRSSNESVRQGADEKRFKSFMEVFEDKKIKKLGDWADQMRQYGLDWDGFIRMIWTLVGDGYLQLIQPHTTSSETKSHLSSKGLNDALLKKAQTDQSVRVLVSPVTGLGVPVEAHRQLFLLARSIGLKSPEQWGAAALGWLNERGQSVEPTELTQMVRRACDMGVKDPIQWALAALQFLQINDRLPEVDSNGVAPLSQEEALQELIYAAHHFEQGQLPILQKLGVVS